jgi:hypothetical protein
MELRSYDHPKPHPADCMSAIIEHETGYASFLICDHKEITVFYRTGSEIAVYHKSQKLLAWSVDWSEADR